MIRMHLRLFAVAVATLPLVQTAALADYMDVYAMLVGPGQQSQGVAFPGGDPPGVVRIQAYDGKGTSGGGLQAGQVRLTFWADWGLSAPAPGQTLGLQAVAFNTDLNLSAAQINLPAGWHSSPNPLIITTAPFYDLGTFSWGAGTVSNIENGVSMLITGLGTTATPAHFLLGSMVNQDPPAPFESAVFAANAISQSFGVEVSSGSGWLATNANGISAVDPAATPEPCTLVLASLGVVGLLGRQAMRRRRGHFHGGL